jgi:polar amino acid transport system permease protein
VRPDPGPSTGVAPAPEEWTPGEHKLKRRAARRQQNRRRIGVAAILSVLVIGGLVAIVLRSSGWPVVQQAFFDVSFGRHVLPLIWDGFKVDLLLVVIATVFIAIISLTLALLRTSAAPALAPFRILAAVYVDLFRGTPLILVIYP